MGRRVGVRPPGGHCALAPAPGPQSLRIAQWAWQPEPEKSMPQAQLLCQPLAHGKRPCRLETGRPGRTEAWSAEWVGGPGPRGSNPGLVLPILARLCRRETQDVLNTGWHLENKYYLQTGIGFDLID